MDEDSNKFIEDLVRKHAAQIGEHVDTVHVFITKHGIGGAITKSFHYGIGNHYAREAHIREWLSTQDEYVREAARMSQRKELEE